jgi:hypothetical protein
MANDHEKKQEAGSWPGRGRALEVVEHRGAIASSLPTLPGLPTLPTFWGQPRYHPR